MSHSSFCIEQRKKELQRSQKILTLGLLASAGVHALLSLVIVEQYKKTTIADDAIELIIIEEPSPVPKSPKPAVKNQKSAVKSQPLSKTEVPNEGQQSAFTQSPKPQPQTKLISKVPQNRLSKTSFQPQSIALATSNQTTAANLETSPVLSIAPTNTNIPLKSNHLQPKPVTEIPQTIEQFKTRLENSSSAPPQPTAANLETSPVLSIAPTNTNIPLKTNPPQPKPVAETPQTIEQFKTSLDNSSSAPSIESSNNQNRQPTSVAALTQPTAPQIGKLAPSFANSTNSHKNTSFNSSQPGTVFGNNQGMEQINLRSGETPSGLSVEGSRANSKPSNDPGSSSPSTVAARSSAPERPTSPEQGKKLRCVRECKPSYPSVLNGTEGSATVKLMIDSNGDVISVTLVRPNNNSLINQQVFLAAKQMKFTSSPNGDRAEVQLTINFTVAGSEFHRQARKRGQQQQRESQAREQERKARQAQLEQERRERQRQLELERAQRERQAQLDQERKR